jgi:polyhydroxyalkanoate synthesis repressor PhaR
MKQAQEDIMEAGKVRVIKRYGNRKLYDTSESRYVNLAQIRAILQSGDDVLVIDNNTKEDLTGSVLTRAMGDYDELLPVDEIKGIIRKMNGFSLIEVMVALSILSIVMLGMMTQMEVQALQAVAADTKAAVTAFDQSLTSVASDATACTAAITKTVQSYAKDVRFDLADGRVVAAGSAQQDYSGVIVRSFTYDNAAQVAQLKDGTKVYYGTLNLVMYSKRKMIGPNSFAVRSIASVYLTTAPNSQIVYCGAAAPPALAQAAQEAAADKAAQDAAEKAKQEARNQSNCLLSGGSYSAGVCSYRQPASDDHDHDHGNKNDGKDGSPCDGNAGRGND